MSCHISKKELELIISPDESQVDTAFAAVAIKLEIEAIVMLTDMVCTSLVTPIITRPTSDLPTSSSAISLLLLSSPSVNAMIQ